MKKFAILLSIAALAACAEEAPAPVDQEEVAAQETSLGLPGKDEFTAAYAATCPEAAPVESTLCEAVGLGQSEFTCDFALEGDASQSRTGTLTATDGEWTLAANEEICSAE